MKKQINWSKVIEWTILVICIVGLLIGAVEYVKTIPTFQVLITILVFFSGTVVGAILMKWYVKYVMDIWK